MRAYLFALAFFAAAAAVVMLSGCAELEAECGDKICNRIMESSLTCPQDCGGRGGNGTGTEVQAPLCGNGIIEKGEDCATCQQDVKCLASQKCLQGKCVPLEACKTNADCDPNKKCVKGGCELQTCKERKGSICGTGQLCNGRLISASDSTNCCSEACVYRACKESHGKLCEDGSACTRKFLPASDTKECCPFEALCIEGATCSPGDGCVANCERGDFDCNCMLQVGKDGSPMVDANTCLIPEDYIYSTEATGCCNDLVIAWPCSDSDDQNYFKAGSCVDHWDTNSGKSVNARSFRDYCTIEGGVNKIVEYVCATGFYGERRESCTEVSVPVASISGCTRCEAGKCVK
ncbi:MAG: hypothetical protein V1676_00915 [Candidatus Diapherotrites archaeon]